VRIRCYKEEKKGVVKTIGADWSTSIGVGWSIWSAYPLDANIAGIMAAIQSIQSRIDMLERNLTDRVKDLTDYQKETRSGLQTRIEASEKKQKTSFFITWIIIIIGIIVTAFILKL
jgi:hypothetical protein